MHGVESRRGLFSLYTIKRGLVCCDRDTQRKVRPARHSSYRFLNLAQQRRGTVAASISSSGILELKCTMQAAHRNDKRVVGVDLSQHHGMPVRGGLVRD